MKQIRLTEQDIHTLVEDAVRSYLVNEGVDEGFWGGVSNAMHGAFGKNGQGQRNFNFNLGQTYRSGRDASSFAKYAQQAGTAIKGMKDIATNTGNKNVSNSLNTVAKNIQSVAQQYTTQAQNVANGDAKQIGKVNNPWSRTQKADDIQAQYDDLNQQYNTLQGNYNTLQGNYDTMQSDYNTLQGNYNTLQGDYNQYKKQNPAQQQPQQKAPGAPARQWTQGELDYFKKMGYNPEQYNKQPQQKQGFGQRVVNGVKSFFGGANNESRSIVVTQDDIRNLVTETVNILLNGVSRR